ncbi:uncharacterized protein A1O9_00924 [Exophiala aquamarina CBS 119918]|uniref:Oxysterol-binding protein n=1 Tax=Exophiala aquamarina CBS 119918 TaxID=1182545 RepID=A0A072Q4W2_9EURO|nr:uncharacterized protein A1O9_00924 [Exophiala aquamarina CBS 119918]KEF62950.1 hypothetical protein A1O9_00924 [Exophiala aquamarina CBS 119918]
MAAPASVHHDHSQPQVIPPGRIAEFMAFLKSMRNFKGDLSTVSAPIFILGPTSLTEYVSYWCEQASLFVAPASQSTPELRALAVLKWYLSTLRGQYGRREGIGIATGPIAAGRKGPGRKKPLNPILGEIFKGHWDDEYGSGRTELIAEQVSHQPPVTAYHIRNLQHQIRLEGYHLQKTYFCGMPHIEKIGHVMLSLDQYDESYVMTMPDLHLKGLLPPPPYPELDRKTFIAGNNGLTAEIDFFGRGWIRGKRNSFRAKLFYRDKPKDILYRIEGQWQDVSFTVFNASGGKLENFNTDGVHEITPITVAPISEQSPLESRRVWQHVANGIVKGDLATAAMEKNKLEEEQRALRLKESTTGDPWEPSFFRAAKDWKEAEGLLRSVGVKMASEETRGVWRWVGGEHGQQDRFP